MKPGEFEQELKQQPLRTVPPDWRAEILVTANALAGSPVLTPSRPFWSFWREWLWPCPQAWAGLAAVWLVILGLHASKPSESAGIAQVPTPPPVEPAAALSSQRQELARLLDNAPEPAPTPAPAPSRISPGPRSERSSPPRA